MVADRIVKNMVIQRPIAQTLIPGFIGMTYMENTGMAFGLMNGQTVLLSVITAVVVVGMLFTMKRFVLSSFTKLAFGLVLGGAVGNLIDRLFMGYVVDMFVFEFVSFAVFNVADAAVTVGALLLAFSIMFRPRDWEVRKRV